MSLRRVISVLVGGAFEQLFCPDGREFEQANLQKFKCPGGGGARGGMLNFRIDRRIIEGDHWRRVSCKLIKLLSLCLLVLWFDFFFTLTGIRSQSKPNDIMGEVYRAMMSLGYVSAILGDFLTHSLDSTAFSPALLSLSFLIIM